RDLARAEAVLRKAGIRRGRRGPRGRPQSGWPSLTPAEQAVASLVADGLTNPQIGARLYISRRARPAPPAPAFTKRATASRARLRPRPPPAPPPPATRTLRGQRSHALLRPLCPLSLGGGRLPLRQGPAWLASGGTGMAPGRSRKASR